MGLGVAVAALASGATLAACFIGIDDGLVDRARADAGITDGPAVPADQGVPDSGADGSPDYRAMVLADQPIAYWRLGERQPGLAADQRETYPGTYGGAATKGVGGAVKDDSDTAVHFERPEDLVTASYPALRFAGRASFSVEAWVRTSSMGEQCVVGCIGRNATNNEDGYLVSLTMAGRASFTRFSSDIQESVVATMPVPLGGGYVHIVAVHDEKAGMWVYTNGVASGPAQSTLSIGAHPGALTLAARTEGFPCLAGDLDEVAIYDRALTGAEILRHYIRATGR